AVLLAHAVGAQWLVGGRRERFAGAQAEVREMSWADDLAVLHLGSLQRFTIVRAAVLDRVQLGTPAPDDQVLALQRHGERRRLADRVGGTHIDPPDTHTMPRPCAQNIPVCSRAASDIMLWFQGGSKVNVTRASRTVGMRPILSRTSSTRIS